MTIRSLATAFALLSFPVAATAATFDFTGYSDGGHEVLTESDGGLTVTMSAGIYAGNGTTAFVTDYDGFGILGLTLGDLVVSTRDDCFLPTFLGCAISDEAGIGVGLAPGGGTPQIAGGIYNDLLTFTFDQMVDFESVSFGHVDSNDNFDLFVDGTLVAPGNFGIPASGTYSLTGLSGTSLSIGADSLGDNFNITGLSASAGSGSNDPNVIPLPAGGLLLLSGLGVLALRRRNG